MSASTVQVGGVEHAVPRPTSGRAGQRPHALAIGLGTIVAPWFVMQPAMGAGLAGSGTPNPAVTRLRNLGTHTVSGLGLYLAAAAL